MSTETLTSLAMLKVHVDQGRDYLDYLRPFILQSLIVDKPDPITDGAVRDLISRDFGLEIPERAIQIVLRRLSRQHSLKLEHGVYRIDGELPDPRIESKKADAIRHIGKVLAGLKEFSKTTSKPIVDDDEAVTAICAFLLQFNIPCIRAYLRGTAIPDLTDSHDAEIVLVGKYVLDLQDKNPEGFDSFLVVVTGHMLANALLCPDLRSAPKSYKGVTFYLDTPLLIRQLGLEGNFKQVAVKNLIDILHNLGATVATFTHLRGELEGVITGAAQHVEYPSGRGDIVAEARQSRTTKSDLVILIGQIDDKLEDAGIKVVSTPRYIEKFQIDETEFEHVLDDEISYFNPRARENDINSVRSIYVLRGNISAQNLERTKAVLVTSNTGFARAAFQFGKQHEASRDISSVITDFSLANMAWLKAPLGAPAIPATELLALSYAALEPSKELFEKYLYEIDKLEGQGKITARDHQLLRSSHLASAELMNLTLGEEDALTEQTVTEMLRRVTEEIQREENDKYRKERDAHQRTQEELARQQADRERVQKRIHRRCQRQATACAWCATVGVVLVLAVGLMGASFGVAPENPMVAGLFATALVLWTVQNWIWGTTIKNVHGRVRTWCLKWLLRRKAAEIGLDLDPPQ